MNSTEIVRYLKNPGLLTEATLPVLEQLVKVYPWFQTGWVLYLKNLYNLNHPSCAAVLKQSAIRTGSRKELKKFIKKTASEGSTQHFSEKPDPVQMTEAGIDWESYENQGIKENKRQLIDHFLAEETGFKPQTKERAEGSIPDHSEKSIVESAEIVTETYANLLFVQGNFERALHAFEKLSLKFPEKSIYFAGRIQEMIELLNKK